MSLKVTNDKTSQGEGRNIKPNRKFPSPPHTKPKSVFSDISIMRMLSGLSEHAFILTSESRTGFRALVKEECETAEMKHDKKEVIAEAKELLSVWKGMKQREAESERKVGNRAKAKHAENCIELLEYTINTIDIYPTVEEVGDSMIDAYFGANTPPATA